MRDRAVCIRLDVTTARVAWLFWVVAAACIIANLLVATYDLGFVGVFFVGAAATLHVRQFICEHDRNAIAAFELGREAGRLDAAVPSQRTPSDPVRIH